VTVQVIGTQFSRPGETGDFGWMLQQPEYADALFVFNDNEEQFRAHRADPAGDYGCARGVGNAAIRPFQCIDPPRAAGIPTGTLRSGGHPELTPPVQNLIDDAIDVINDLLATGRYDRVFYSAANAEGDLGTGTFRVGDDVKRYIVAGLRALAV
jgi:hypothetical protein